MNVLFFVMSMLMLFAILTYGRLESFRNFAFMQVMFTKYMKETERQYVNRQAVKRYQDTVATTRAGQPSEEANPASSKLSFELFVNAEKRGGDQDALEAHRRVATNLMAFLYNGQPFYDEIEARRSNFLNEILDALEQKTEALTGKEKLGKVKEIATVDFKDEALNDVFTKMLKGTVEKLEKSRKAPFKPEGGGYYSLLDFITIESDKTKIRVFLASPQLLMALYGNSDTVESILRERYRLYTQVKNDRSPAEAGEEFKGLFSGSANVPDTMLDFGVSKTNPRQYE